MKCSKCGATISAGSAFCASCGTPLEAGEGKGPAEVSREWLKSILERMGFEAKLSDKSPNVLSGRHATHPNLILTIRRDLGMVMIQSWWTMKKQGWGQDKTVRDIINKANNHSFANTFYLDDEGDLGVSAYVWLMHRLTEPDIVMAIEKVSDGFFSTARSTGLHELLS